MVGSTSPFSGLPPVSAVACSLCPGVRCPQEMGTTKHETRIDSRSRETASHLDESKRAVAAFQGVSGRRTRVDRCRLLTAVPHRDSHRWGWRQSRPAPGEHYRGCWGERAHIARAKPTPPVVPSAHALDGALMSARSGRSPMDIADTEHASITRVCVTCCGWQGIVVPFCASMHSTRSRLRSSPRSGDSGKAKPSRSRGLKSTDLAADATPSPNSAQTHKA